MEARHNTEWSRGNGCEVICEYTASLIFLTDWSVFQELYHVEFQELYNVEWIL